MIEKIINENFTVSPPQKSEKKTLVSPGKEIQDGYVGSVAYSLPKPIKKLEYDLRRELKKEDLSEYLQGARCQSRKGEELKDKNPPVTISIIHTNDLHGRHTPINTPNTGNVDMGGTPFVASLIKELEKKETDEASLIVDVGDVAYAPPVSDKFHFEPMADVMNKVGYEIMTLGNHEFQWGVPVLEKEFISKLKFPVVISNVVEKATNAPLPNTLPYIIEDIKGIKVGILGLLTPKMATDAHPQVGKDVKVENPADCARRVVKELKRLGVDVIVALTHEGLDADKELAKSVEGINLIIAGHDHEKVSDPIVVINPAGEKTLVVEAGSYGEYVGNVELMVDTDKKVIKAKYELYPVYSKQIKPDPEVKTIVDKFLHEVGEVFHKALGIG